MASNVQNCKVVFLIDTHHPDDNKEQTDYSKIISLSVLKILTALSARHRHEKNFKSPAVKWGYKFFNSQVHKLKVETYCFKEFKLRHFEEFDRDLLKKLNSSSHDKICGTSSKTPVCECFARSLTELTHDFEWETPDIFSPVKKKRNRNKCNKSCDFDKGNYVFLFAACPKTAVELRKFAKKKVLDHTVFLDSIMPTSLNSVFCDRLCLTLCWIDTDTKVYESADISSLRLVETALEKIKGKVIPLDAIIHHGKQHLAVLSSGDCTEPRKDQSQQDQATGDNSHKSSDLNSALVPFTSLFDYYVRGGNLSNRTTEKCQSVLKYNGRSLCVLEMKNTQNNDSGNEMNNGNLMEKDKLTSSCLTIDLPSLGENITVLTSPTNSVHIPESLDVYGIVSQSSVQPDSQGLFVCVAKTENEERSVVFQNLMLYLMNEKLDLVISVQNQAKFFLLRPLTSTSSTLVTVAMEMILEIEKQRVLQENEDLHAPEEIIKSAENVDYSSWGSLVSKLCSKEKKMLQNKDKTEDKRSSSGGRFNARSVDKTHLPGCQAPFISLIDKLNDKISQLEFLSDNEVKTLKQLQKMYHVQSRPPQLIDHTPQSKGMPAFQENDSSLVEESKGDAIKSSVQSRGRMIVTRSKQAVKDMVDETTKQSGEEPMKERPSVDVTLNVDFQDETELKKYLHEMYEKTVLGDSGSLYSAIQPLVTIALHYMRESGKDNPQESCAELLNSGLVLSAERLRLKHQDDADKQQKIKEYQLQIVLRMEIQSMLYGGDQSMISTEDKVEEIVTLLRTISFITEPKHLSEFMKNTLVYNFIHNMPQMLGSIYDELMQPYPADLEAVLSPDESAGDSSVFNQSMQSCGDTSVMSQPQSNVSDVLLNRPERKSSRSRKLVHHPSLADFGPKRQIVVSTKPTKDKQESIDEKRKKKAKEREKRKLERRQSVAVMETVKSSSRKRKLSGGFKSPKYNLKSPHKRLVSETPTHKQKSHMMWKRMERERRRTLSVVDVKVVAESPIKKDVTDGLDKNSPPQKKRALNTVRRSFYSAGPINRTRSLTNSLELADRIAGRNTSFTKKSKRQSLFDLKSPDRNSSFLLSQLMGSPGSTKKTPGKKMSLTQALQSPSQNTRSKTPSKVMSSQKALFKDKSPRRSIKKLSFTPVKTEAGILIPDSPCMNTRSHTPGKIDSTPSKSSIISNHLLQSPSQNTRSKFTPTRHSVKAKLFVVSPEPQMKTKGNSGTSCGKNASNSKLTDTCLDDVKSKGDKSFASVNHNKGDNSSSSSEKTPSPSKKQTIKTPGSLDSWPRKKKWTKIKYEESPQINQKRKETATTDECESVKSSRSSTSTSDDDEVVVRVTDKIDSDVKEVNPVQSKSFSIKNQVLSSKRSLALSPDAIYESPAKRKCFSPSKSNAVRSTQSPAKQKCFSPSKSNVLRSTPLDSHEIKETEPKLKTLRKRTSNFSPDNSVFSPSKRFRSTNQITDSPKKEVSLHSHLLIRNFSNISDGIMSSQGFNINDLGSQGSSQSVDILSIADDSEEISQTNDAVFTSPIRRSSALSPLNDENITSGSSFCRTQSPVFGSSKKNKFQNRLRSHDLNVEMNSEENLATIKSPCAKVLSEDDKSKVSPSTRKYSPSVSAKSLCHLISSPLLNSPSVRENKVENSTIDQDSLNVRRQKMSGRIRRSLIQN